MRIKVEALDVRHAKAHNKWRHCGLHSRAGFSGGRLIEVVLKDYTYVGIVYPFAWSKLEDFASDVGPDEPA